jgi:hypothetical protein
MIARFNPQAEDLQRFQVGPNRGGIDHQKDRPFTVFWLIDHRFGLSDKMNLSSAAFCSGVVA